MTELQRLIADLAEGSDALAERWASPPAPLSVVAVREPGDVVVVDFVDGAGPTGAQLTAAFGPDSRPATPPGATPRRRWETPPVAILAVAAADDEPVEQLVLQRGTSR